jgi:hypothetical protein
MLVHTNHGFRAPMHAHEELLQFLGSLPSVIYGAAVQAIQAHYQVCRALRVEIVKEQPDYLDIFKDARTEKRWRSCDREMVLINSSSILRTWPDLMHSGWNSVHAVRDIEVLQEQCRRVVQELHEAIDKEGQDITFKSYYTIKNHSWFLVV